MTRLTLGAPAPDFELPDQNGNAVSLRQFRGVCPVVVFFYPKDGTSVCTKEACSFRDNQPAFEAAGARILGISSDSGDSHTRFAAKYGLAFSLLSDKGGQVRKLYGVKSRFGIIPGRVTFVIDREGILRHEFSSLTEPEKHVSEALAALGQG